MRGPKLIFALLAFFALVTVSASATVRTWPAAPGQIQSSDYQVLAGGKSVFVSTTPVLRGAPASYAWFEFSGSAQIKVTSALTISTFKILPSSLGITGTVTNNQLVFSLTTQANLTIEINGSTENVLHLFADPIETNIPSASTPNVIYFGPGVHEVSTLNPRSGQVIYLARGAVLKAVIPDDEVPVDMVERDDGEVEKIYHPFIEAGDVNNVTIRGRGIIDLSGLPWHARKAIWFDGSSNILIQGITILDSPDWAVVINKCSNVLIRNIKQIASRENSDGIDICNSQNVTVEKCFLRCNDDGISVKTLEAAPAMKSQYITVQNCVIWNERARAMGITSETLADISDVTFQNCDIIHDLSEGGDCAALAILVSDSGTISNIVFSDIRIEDSRTKLIRCWIGGDGWSQDSNRGHIKDVTFDKIAVTGGLPVSEFYGYDPSHPIENVSLNMQVNGNTVTSLKAANVVKGSYVNNLQLVAN